MWRGNIGILHNAELHDSLLAKHYAGHMLRPSPLAPPPPGGER
jgi:hypothetical protein